MNYDLDGWFQTEKYFDISLTKHFFSFEEGISTNIKSRFKKEFSQPTILISIRRGDFVDHQDYFQLPINFYLNALIHNFPDWKTRNIFIFSDDINYCKFHFSFLENVIFSDGLSAIEQLVIATFCDDFIISNSTFSWWCAWLGEKENSKIIRPLHYFTPLKRKLDDDKDYFPSRWKIYDHLDVKIDLDTTSIVMKKPNKIVEAYMNYNFAFVNQNQILYLNSSNSHKIENNLQIILMDDFIPPPFSIYNAVQLNHIDNQETVFLLKGKSLDISAFWDYKVLKKQFDFGVFSCLLNKSLALNNNIPIFHCVSNNIVEDDLILFPKNSQNYKLIFSYSGKLKGIFECKYYLAVQKRKYLFDFKNFVKK